MASTQLSPTIADVSMVDEFQVGGGPEANNTPSPRESPKTQPLVVGQETPSIEAFGLPRKYSDNDEPFQISMWPLLSVKEQNVVEAQDTASNDRY